MSFRNNIFFGIVIQHYNQVRNMQQMWGSEIVDGSMTANSEVE